MTALHRYVPLLVVLAGTALMVARAADPPAEISPKAKKAPVEKATASTAAKPVGAKCPRPAARRWAANLAAWKAEDSHEEADNSFCYVCHVNYKKDKLAKHHQPEGVGCETCHGISDKHSEDEDNITPPDVMFARKEVISFCTECHAKKDLLEEEEHEEIFSKNAQPDSACTDCHGLEHRLTVRTRRWDKVSGKLIWDDGVRMMEKKPRAKK